MFEGGHPKVSVFIASYQHKEFIREALGSVLTQDYPNLEIVIGDDGSNDGTQEILKEYKQKYSELIKLTLSEKNAGITVSCNRILKECTGKYIAFMAGDDLMLPDKISIQTDYMEKHPECSISYHNLEVFDSAARKTIGLFNDPKVNYPYEGNAGVIIQYGCFNGAASNMVRRSDCPPHGFDTRIPIASDWLFWVETLMNGGEIRYIDKVLGKYRIHQNNVSKASSTSILLNFEDHLNSANIILLNHPEFVREILYRKSKIYETLITLNKSNNNYIYYRMSNKLRWNWIDRLYGFFYKKINSSW